MEKILVIGGAGFIGSHTVDALVKIGHELVVLDNLQKPVHLKGKPSYLNPKVKYIWGDVRNRNDLIDALKGVDVIYHFAAYQDYLPDFSTFFDVNSVGTALLYEIIVEKSLKIKKIIIASSQFVQGEGVYKTLKEDFYYPNRRSNSQLSAGIWNFKDKEGNMLEWNWTNEEYANPPNQYAISKYTQELMAINLGERYEIPSVALRYSIVQGSRQSFYNAYSGACRIFSLSYYHKKPPVLYEDGLMLRDFINIKDVVNANLLVLEKEEANNQVYCIGGGTACKVIDFALETAKAYNCEDLPPKITGEYRFGDTRNACSDITKIMKLGWRPKYNIKDSIKEYKQYLEEQLDIDDILDYAKAQMQKMNVVRSADIKI